jgi:hypothetical protein
MIHHRRNFTVLAALAICAPPCLAADDWSPLLGRVPETANALVLIDAQAILASPVAIREDWVKKQQTAYVQGTATLPPSVARALFAANLEPTTMHSRWEVGLLASKNPVSLPTIAKLEGGALDTIADQSVVLSTKRNVYFTQVANDVVGVFFPANRQELGRWLRSLKKDSTAELSSYLKDAAAKAAPITMAIDMTDMVDAKQVGIYLGKAAALKGKNVDTAGLVKLLTDLKGLTLSIRFADAIQGELTVNFAASPSAYAAVLKPLLLETLGNFGCMIDSLADGETAISGNAFVVRAKFTTAEARRVLTLVHPPTPPVESAESASGQFPSTDPVIMASKRYFSETNRILDDLELKRKTIENEKLWNMWHDKYAEEIDRLPLTKVDPELLRYGAELSSRLRTISVSVKGVNIKTRAMESGKRGGWDYYGGYYSNSADVEQQKAEERARGQLDRLDIWKLIEEDQANMRKRMIAKYKIDF